MTELDPEKIVRQALKPLLEAFRVEIAKMRMNGESDADIEALLLQVEAVNRGKIDDETLAMCLLELRREAFASHDAPEAKQ